MAYLIFPELTCKWFKFKKKKTVGYLTDILTAVPARILLHDRLQSLRKMLLWVVYNEL